MTRVLIVEDHESMRESLAAAFSPEQGFEVVGDDTLSGIFTNKEKSIYYYVYLTEASPARTENACRLLNQVFYGR